MSPNDNRRPGVASRNGGDDYDSSNNAKVIPPLPKLKTVSPFDQLTAKLVMAKHRAGTLDPGVVEGLLMGVGLL